MLLGRFLDETKIFFLAFVYIASENLLNLPSGGPNFALPRKKRAPGRWSVKKSI